MIDQIDEVRKKLLTSLSITRVEPYIRDRVVVPSITYDVIQDDLEQTCSGGSLHRTEIDFRCLDDDYQGAEDLAEAVRAILDGWEPEDIAAFQRSGFERTYDLPIESSNNLLYSVTCTLTLWWSES